MKGGTAIYGEISCKHFNEYVLLLTLEDGNSCLSLQKKRRNVL